jgi:signal transduction histidine kinase
MNVRISEMREPSDPSADAADPRRLRDELEELCRLHDVSVELIERSDDAADLMVALLDEYERRLDALPVDSLGNTPEQDPAAGDDTRVRTLVRFASQAVALKQRAETVERLRRQTRELEESKVRAEQAMRASDEAARRLDGVLQALDSGIMILSADGSVAKANRAALELTGERELEGPFAERIAGGVPPMGDGEVTVPGSDGGRPKVLLVSRRRVGDEDGDEVVLLHDVTERDRVVAERHENEKMAALLRAVGVLAHKINNPLTALLGRTQILRMSGIDEPRTAKAAEVIEESGRRIADLIRELAAVVKTGDLEHLERVLHVHERSGGREGDER